MNLPDVVIYGKWIDPDISDMVPHRGQRRNRNTSKKLHGKWFKSLK